MAVPSVHSTGALYKVVLGPGAREQVMTDLQGKNIYHEELLPGPEELEVLCKELSTALTNSQSSYKHFQWKVEVLPKIELRGLNATVIKK